jgi:hypothetical protein
MKISVFKKYFTRFKNQIYKYKIDHPQLYSSPYYELHKQMEQNHFGR